MAAGQLPPIASRISESSCSSRGASVSVGCRHQWNQPTAPPCVTATRPWVDTAMTWTQGSAQRHSQAA
eukprot:5550225-Prymnesium_polylepis.1